MHQDSNNIHVWRRQMLSLTFGGIDEDVERVFLSLQPAVLSKILADYKRTHGTQKHAYAKKTYPKWKSREVLMSGEVCERLLAIVPRYLDFGTKYDLVVKLWRRQDTTRLKVTIDPDMEVGEAVEAVMRAIDTLKDKGIPEALVARLNWLAENDAVVAQDLFRQVLTQEHALAKEVLRPELQKLLGICQIAPDSILVDARRDLTIPGGTVYVEISDRRSPKKPWSKQMSDEPAQPQPKEASGNLVPADNQQQGRQLAPIQNPNDLLGEALRHMPAQKQAEVMGKAADEALRLQVKCAENKIDLDTLNEKLDQAARVARDVAANENVQIEFTTEHKSKQGDTRINVKSKPEKPVVIQNPRGSCFVATACYGDFDHPVVLQLRGFRDEVLSRSLAGEVVVQAYYRVGPLMAAGLEALPIFKPVVRFGLWLLVTMIAGCRWLDMESRARQVRK